MEYEKSRQRKGSEFLEKQIIGLDFQPVCRLFAAKYRRETASRSLVTTAFYRNLYHAVSGWIPSQKIQRLAVK